MVSKHGPAGKAAKNVLEKRCRAVVLTAAVEDKLQRQQNKQKCYESTEHINAVDCINLQKKTQNISDTP